MNHRPELPEIFKWIFSGLDVDVLPYACFFGKFLEKNDEYLFD
jgi:hypothetical protein